MSASSEWYFAWQAAQTLLVLLMLAIMWRLHRRLDALRDARAEASAWLEQFSQIMVKTEVLLRQARLQQSVGTEQPKEVGRDDAEKGAARIIGPNSATQAPAAGGGREIRGVARGTDDGKITRLEDLLGRLR